MFFNRNKQPEPNYQVIVKDLERALSCTFSELDENDLLDRTILAMNDLENFRSLCHQGKIIGNRLCIGGGVVLQCIDNKLKITKESA